MQCIMWARFCVAHKMVNRKRKYWTKLTKMVNKQVSHTRGDTNHFAGGTNCSNRFEFIHSLFGSILYEDVYLISLRSIANYRAIVWQFEIYFIAFEIHFIAFENLFIHLIFKWQAWRSKNHTIPNDRMNEMDFKCNEMNFELSNSCPIVRNEVKWNQTWNRIERNNE